MLLLQLCQIHYCNLSCVYDNLLIYFSYFLVEFLNGVSTLDHNIIGLNYILFGISCGFIGAFLSLSISIELLVPGYFLFSGSEIAYNVSITSHGIIMIFFAVMPIFISGFGNYFIPLMIGCSDMSLPSINNLAFLILVFSFIVLNVSLGVLGGSIIGVSSGWTLYPPLSILPSSGSISLLILSLHLNGISSILNSLNSLATLHFCSCLSKWHLNMFCWSIFITSYLLLLVLPVLVVAITFLLTDSILGSCFYSSSGGGDPVLFQHLFWLFGHPEVYILILPSFGIVSELISEYTSSNLLGYNVMIWSMLSIAFLGCLVWAHHMFTIGMEVDSNCYFTIASSLIAIPTGLKVVLWISSFFNSFVNLNIVNSFLIMFIVNFIFGGVTGVWIAQAGLDLLLHDTYFIVAHFHYVMAISIIYVFFAAFYNWFFIFFGLNYNLLFANSHMWSFFIGSNIVFAPMHLLGSFGMPSSVFDYPSCFIFLNQFSTLGLFIIFVSIVYFIFSLLNINILPYLTPFFNEVFFYIINFNIWLNNNSL